MRLFKFIDAERANFPVYVLCKILGVSKSGYYGWKGRPPSRRNRENGALTEKVRQIHERSRETYGSPRVHAELRELGVRCSRKRVERLMRKAGLQGCMRGRRKGTTRRGKRSAAVEDLVKRNFGLATVWWTDTDLVPEVYAKEKKCRAQDRRTRRSFAVRRSGWCRLQTRSTPSPG